jgi:hypothetical protein
VLVESGVVDVSVVDVPVVDVPDVVVPVDSLVPVEPVVVAD